MLFCLHSFLKKIPFMSFHDYQMNPPFYMWYFNFASLTNSGKLPQHAILIVTHLKPVAISRHFSCNIDKNEIKTILWYVPVIMYGTISPPRSVDFVYTIVCAKWCEVGCRLWIEWAQRGRGSDFTQSALILPHEQMVGNKTLII